MNLGAVLFLSALFFCAYTVGGIRDPKRFLLFGGIVSVPFEITYSFYFWQPHNGWTSGIQISLSEVFFVLLFFLIRSRRGQAFHVSRNIVWAIVLFIVASGLSGLNSEVHKLTVCQMLMVAQLFALYYWVFVNSLESQDDIRAVLNYLGFSMVLQGVFCLLLYWPGLNFNRVLSTGHWGTSLIFADAGDGGGYLRAVGSFPQPNALAAYLVPLVLLQLAVLLGTRERSRLRLLALCGGLFAVLTSFSRGGWVSLLVCFPLLMIGLGRWRVAKAIVLGVVITAVALTITPVRQRLLGDDHNAAASRLPLMHLAMNIVKAHPLIGVGANTYAMAKYKYLDASLDGAYLDQVHNMYLLVFAETGLLGLGAFVLFLIYFFKEAKPCLEQSSDSFSRSVALGIRIGLVATMLHMCVDMFHCRSLMSSIFLLCGLLTAVKCSLELPQPSEEREELESLGDELPQAAEARQA